MLSLLHLPPLPPPSPFYPLPLFPPLPSYPPTLLLSSTEATLQPFYFIDFQTLCEIPDNDSQRFLPCELAVVEYTVKDGIQRTLHKFIDPGEL